MAYKAALGLSEILVGVLPAVPSFDLQATFARLSAERPSRPTRTAQHSECSNGHGPRFWQNLWQMVLRAGVEGALCLVELRGFEPLTPCIPLTSRWLMPQHVSIRSLLLALVSTPTESMRHGAA